jgi:hypothetical protein
MQGASALRVRLAWGCALGASPYLHGGGAFVGTLPTVGPYGNSLVVYFCIKRK